MTSWLAGVQLSVASTLARTLGTAPWQFAVTDTVIGAGELRIVGGVVSTTANDTFAAEVLPEASVTLTAIVYWPVPSGVPAAGSWLITNWLAGVQLSVARVWLRTS